MAGENNKLVKGLGAGEMQLTSDFALVDENGSDLFRVDASTGDVTASGTIGGGGTPGGANTQVQYNNAGAFGGDAGLTYNAGTDTLTSVNATVTGTLDTSTGSINAATVTATTSKITGMTDGSLLFAGAGDGTLTQDNVNLFYDDTANQLGLGTNTPSATLDLVGTLQFTDGNQGNGKVLTSDASGNATWQASSGGSPAGVGGELQFNDGGNFGASNVVTDGTNIGINTLTLTHRINADLGGEGQAFFTGSHGEYTAIRLENTVSSDNIWFLAALSGTSTVGPSKGFALYDALNDKAPIKVEFNTPSNTLYLDNAGRIGVLTASPAVELDVNGTTNATSYSVGGAAGASGGPFTTITSITVVNGIVTAITGS